MIFFFLSLYYWPVATLGYVSNKVNPRAEAAMHLQAPWQPSNPNTSSTFELFVRPGLLRCKVDRRRHVLPVVSLPQTTRAEEKNATNSA
jgi:hypothetical protein